MPTMPLTLADVAGRPYLYQRVTNDAGTSGHVELFDPETADPVARVAMAVGGAIFLETYGRLLPREVAEWLFANADWCLV